MKKQIDLKDLFLTTLLIALTSFFHQKLGIDIIYSFLLALPLAFMLYHPKKIIKFLSYCVELISELFNKN